MRPFSLLRGKSIFREVYLDLALEQGEMIGTESKERQGGIVVEGHRVIG